MVSVLQKPKKVKDEYKICPRITPVIITLYDNTLTEFDMKYYIENGLRIIRFRSTKHTINDKIKLLDHLKRAKECCCQKYGIRDWPVAISVDIANGSVHTGFLSDDLRNNEIYLEKDRTIELSSDVKYCFKCDANRIFINDPYTLANIPVGTEVYLDFGKITMVCVEVVNDKTLRCRVTEGGLMKSQEKVCFRGVKYLKPSLSKRDLEDIEFTKTYECDIITINTVRTPLIIGKIKSLFKDCHVPLFLCVICDQEGLDNVHEIISVSDGLILAREYLACSLKKTDQLVKIQLHVGALCKMLEKPFFISGHILQQSVQHDQLIESELSDVNIAMEQGAGLFLRSFSSPSYLNNVFKFLKSICSDVNPVLIRAHQFWDESCKIPANAAEACIHSSFLTANLLNTRVIIVPTVTGKTVKQLSSICKNIFIIAVTKCPVVARRLRLYRGVISVIYDEGSAMALKSEMDPRVKFGAAFAIKLEILKYSCPFVTLKKSTPYSCYCDQVRVWTITSTENTTLQNKAMPTFNFEMK